MEHFSVTNVSQVVLCVSLMEENLQMSSSYFAEHVLIA